MKLLHQINVLAIGINLILLIVPMYAMLAMIPLGLIQLISAIVITGKYYHKLDAKCRKLLEIYWILVAIDFAGIAAVWGYDATGGVPMVIIFFILPAFIAFYLVYVTYSVTKSLSTT